MCFSPSCPRFQSGCSHELAHYLEIIIIAQFENNNCNKSFLYSAVPANPVWSIKLEHLENGFCVPCLSWRGMNEKKRHLSNACIISLFGIAGKKFQCSSKVLISRCAESAALTVG